MLNRYPMRFLMTIGIVILIILGMSDSIPQDTSYHQFADTRTVYHISNFWNVVSNMPFLFVGLYALNKIFRLKTMVYDSQIQVAYMVLFLGVSFVSFGSGYYHLNPNNITLIWDRLPMAIAFMALFSIVISEFIGLNEGKNLLYPLLILGITSVIYWVYTESIGQGDLRLYLFVQFFPMLVIPILLTYFTSTFTLHYGYWYLLLCYVFAKVFEYYDKAIYESLGFISGHSLKHMIAALGLFVLVSTFTNRNRKKLIIRGE